MSTWYKQPMSNPNYPAIVNATKPNKATVGFIERLDSKPRVVAEIGCYMGRTTAELLRFLPDDGELHLYDFVETAQAVADRLADPRVKVFGNTNRVLDYGAHTWHHDALAFLLIDRLLRPDGHVDFDDYEWSLQRSPTLNPNVFPKTAEWYSDEQIASRQVKQVVDLLVRRDPRYTEVVKNRVFRKDDPVPKREHGA